jgi:hypothetical protein
MFHDRHETPEVRLKYDVLERKAGFTVSHRRYGKPKVDPLLLDEREMRTLRVQEGAEIGMCIPLDLEMFKVGAGARKRGRQYGSPPDLGMILDSRQEGLPKAQRHSRPTR